MMVKEIECFGYVRNVMLQEEFCWVQMRFKVRICETWIGWRLSMSSVSEVKVGG